MSEPFLGELRVFPFNYAPKGWAQCNGQMLGINQNQALFALLGTYYGGNGTSTFALPNLQGAFVVGQGTNFSMGSTGGEATHTLIVNEIPAHTHNVQASSAGPTASSPVGAFPAAPSGASPYAASGNTTMVSSTAGSGQPHDNMPPYLTLNVCIALQGIFPSRQ